MGLMTIDKLILNIKRKNIQNLVEAQDANEAVKLIAAMMSSLPNLI